MAFYGCISCKLTWYNITGYLNFKSPSPTWDCLLIYCMMKKNNHELICEIIFEARSKQLMSITSGGGLFLGSTLGVQKHFIELTKWKWIQQVPLIARWSRPLSIMIYTTSNYFHCNIGFKIKSIFCFNIFKISYLYIYTIQKIQIRPIQLHINNLNESLKVTSQNFLLKVNHFFIFLSLIYKTITCETTNLVYLFNMYEIYNISCIWYDINHKLDISIKHEIYLIYDNMIYMRQGYIWYEIIGRVYIYDLYYAIYDVFDIRYNILSIRYNIYRS